MAYCPLASVTGPIIGGAAGDSLGLGSSFMLQVQCLFFQHGSLRLSKRKKTHSKPGTVGHCQ